MKKFPFTIGADPEFNVVSQGRKVDAQYTMRKLLEKDSAFEYDTGLVIEEAGNIGWDGCSSTGELRPSPSNTPKGLVDNIGKLFAEYAKRINLFDLSTLSFHSSVGGHIHFQLPDTDISDTKIKKLHKQMASFYLPLMMSENKINLELRTKGGYGSINDFHGDNWFADDTVRTYEFRVPSAEWITTPKVAEATIAYLAVVWNEMLFHPRNMTKCADVIYKNDKQGVALQELMMSEYTSLSKSIFSDISKHIKTFEYYEAYKEQIDYILNPEKVMKDKMNVNYNIIEGWGLVQSNKFTKRDLNSSKKFKERALSMDLDNIKTLINISYNTDPQCEAFANEISSRAAAFKWKLKKTYFLFGLRKDVGDIMAADMANNIYAGAWKLGTTADRAAFTDLFQKMGSRFRNSRNNNSPMRLDFNTGQIIREDTDTVLIGIPYELRMARKIDPVISLIYDIENGLVDKVKTQDIAVETSDTGTFHNIMNRVAPEIVYADSNAAQNASNIARILDAAATASFEVEEATL